MPKLDYVKAYVDYWAKRREIKQRQRTELEKELLPYAVTLGEALAEARETTNIDDLAATLGRSGKNFIYDMIRVYRAHIGQPPPTYTKPATAPQAPAEAPPEPAYTVTQVDHFNWLVYIAEDDKHYTLTLDSSELVTPEEWTTHSKERRLIYKEIINAVERERDA